MFDIDLDSLYGRVTNYVTYYGRYPEHVSMSQDTLDLLKVKLEHECGVKSNSNISYLMGMEIKVNNVIPFCKIEI